MFILELDVRVRNALVFTVPNLQPIYLCHFVKQIQLLYFEMGSLNDRIIPTLTALIFETVHFTDEVTAVRTTFVSLSSIIVNF